MAKSIMIQGTMSGVGKSLLTAGLCRILRQDGYRAAPFKSQNMALNSFITVDGLEMGRAQVMQAQAAGIEPDVRMNPILLKPTTDTGSQVIVNGEVRGDMGAREYFACKKSLMPLVLDAYASLSAQYDVIVIEGAGSPAEINLKKDDIVNMGLAKAVGAPVLLAGVLEPEEQALLKGLIVNKFRGDKTILDPGIRMLEERSGVPVVGVVPYMQLDIDEEDSLAPQLAQTNRAPSGKPLEIAVVRLPHLSNFTDFGAFSQVPEVDLRYVSRPGALGSPDLVILPGTKNTIADLKWLRDSGMAAALSGLWKQGCPIFGICEGYQMLGRAVHDPDRIEEGGSVQGLGFLDTETIFTAQKRRTRVSGRIGELPGILAPLSGMEIEGYEIHMGRTAPGPDAAQAASVQAAAVQSATAQPGSAGEGTGCFSRILDQRTGVYTLDGAAAGNVYGTYVHGIFDAPGVARRAARALAEAKGISLPSCAESERGRATDIRAHAEAQYDLLAKTLRAHMDLEKIYEIISI